MSEKFSEKTSASCSNISALCEKRYCRRKTDLCPVESLTYIQKDVLRTFSRTSSRTYTRTYAHRKLEKKVKLKIPDKFNSELEIQNTYVEACVMETSVDVKENFTRTILTPKRNQSKCFNYKLCNLKNVRYQ